MSARLYSGVDKVKLALHWLGADTEIVRSAPEVFRAGHNRDMTYTGNSGRTTSGTKIIKIWQKQDFL